MATQAQINDLAALYAGYFDRAPDPAGLQFWIDQIDNGREFNTIAADFAASPEAEALYPYLTTPGVSSPAVFVTEIYTNLFGRAPDAAGLDFWTGVLEAGTVSVADFIEAVINGAVDAPDAVPPTFDASTLDNKVEVGLYFADQTANVPGFVFDTTAKAAAQDALDGITNDPAIVAAAKLEIDVYVAGGSVGQSFNLTTAADNIVGTDANNVINGVVADDDEGASGVNTFGPGDVIDGGAGIDTLRLVQIDDSDNFGDGFGAGATVMNVEILKIVGQGFTDADFDLSGFTGLQQIVADYDTDTDYSIYNLKDELVSVTFDESRSAASDRGATFYLYDIDNSLYTGDDDTLTINVINAGSAEDSSSMYFSHSNVAGDDVFENYNVVVAGDNNYLWIENDSGPSGDEEVKSVVASNAAGNSGSIWIELDEQAALETVDASAMNGDFRFEFNSDVTAGQAISALGGAGNDFFELDFGLDGDYTVDGGEGRDTLAIDADDAGDLADVDFTSFEVIALSGSAAAAATLDADGFEEVQLTVNVSDALSIANLDGGTLTIQQDQSAAVTVESTGSADTLDIVIDDDNNTTLSGGLDLTDVETVNFSSTEVDADLIISTVALNLTGVEALSFSGAGDVDIDVAITGADVVTVDLSDLSGQFDNTGFALDDTALDNVIIGNVGNNSVIELTENSNNTFSFTGVLDNALSIGGFEDGVGGDILDVSSFGVAAFSDLTIVNNGANVDITADEFDGTITLVGVQVAELDGAANFAFA